MQRFSECFSDLPDPRAENALHDLTELLFIALLATLCGAKGCCDIALFAVTKRALLETVLTLKHGVPSLRPLFGARPGRSQRRDVQSLAQSEAIFFINPCET